MEFVFVIPRPSLFPESYPHGFRFFDAGSSDDKVETETTAEAFAACVREHGFFVEREYAERTPALKQVIPYSLVVRQGAAGSPEVLCLRRTKAGGRPACTTSSPSEWEVISTRWTCKLPPPDPIQIRQLRGIHRS
ncbi:MAG: hypothetical protein ABGY29_18545, partial [bacterium]